MFSILIENILKWSIDSILPHDELLCFFPSSIREPYHYLGERFLYFQMFIQRFSYSNDSMLIIRCSYGKLNFIWFHIIEYQMHLKRNVCLVFFPFFFFHLYPISISERISSKEYYSIYNKFIVKCHSFLTSFCEMPIFYDYNAYQ